MQTSEIKIQCESTAWQAQAKCQELQTPASRNVYHFVHLIFEQIKAASLQTELLVMTLLGLVNCTRTPSNWKNQAEKIAKAPMTSKYSEEIKIVLRWVIIARIIIDHMYFVTYLGNLYSVFTWCRPEVLLPWMIVSAVKNFLLELIPLIITSLLYMEGNFPTILFAEFIIESLITFAPAVYYWSGISKLFVELSHLKRRKLTRANLIVESENNATNLDNNFVDNYDIKRKKFMSLMNLDDFSFHSSFEFEGDHEQFRQTKSLTTLTTLESQVSVEPEELLTVSIIEDTPLVPAEKAIKILGLTQEDVNQTRVRLGKKVVTNESIAKGIEDRFDKNQTTALPISARNKFNELILSQEKSEPGDKGESSFVFSTIIETSLTQSPTNGPTDDGNTPKRCACQKTSSATVNVGMVEDLESSMIKIPEDGRYKHENKNDQFDGNEDLHQSASSGTNSLKKNISDQLRSFEVSVSWSVVFPNLDLYKVPDLDDKSYDEDVEILDTDSSKCETSSAPVNVEMIKDIERSMIKIPENGRDNHENKNDQFDGNEDLHLSALSGTDSSRKNVSDQSRRFEASVSWSVEFPESDLYKVPDLDDRSYDEDEEVLDTNFSSSRLNRSFRSTLDKDIDEEHADFLDYTLGMLSRLDVELSKTNDISLEQQNQIDDNAEGLEVNTTHASFEQLLHQFSLSKIENHLSVLSHDLQKDSKNDTRLLNTPDLDLNTDFEISNDKSINDVAKANFISNDSRISTSSTNIGEFWKKSLMNSRRPLKAVLDRNSSKTVTFSESNPDDLPTNPAKMLPPGITRFSKKMKKRPESIKEREAREMKALRAYNRLTLLEDKREMELKKRNLTSNNHAGVQKLFCSPNWINTATNNVREIPKVELNKKLKNQIIRPEVHQVPKRQTRSRPQEKASKLSTFNLDLEALENSISMSFSSDKKRSKLHQATKPNQNILKSQLDSRKQLSKYSKPMRNIDEVSLPPTARPEGLQIGRDLERTCGMENMTHGTRYQRFDRDISSFDQNRLQEVFSATISSSLDSHDTELQNPVEIVGFHDRLQFQDKQSLANLKEAIKNTDWGFNDHKLHQGDIVHHENGGTSHDNVLYDIIDNTEFTISLLKNAFASNPDNIERGFHLGPGSTELYSVSQYLDDVVEEIMKTARFRRNPDTYPAESTTEVDYGLSYLQEFEEISAVTKIMTSMMAETSDDETDSHLDKENNDGTNMHEAESIINEQIISAKPFEMCWNSNFSPDSIIPTDSAIPQDSIIVTDSANERTEENQFDSQSYQDQLKLQTSNDRKNIAKLLGEQEISYIEYWAKELKDLASVDRSNDFEFTKEFQHLTRLPGFCVIKMLVDFFRDFVAVSRSTMTSRMFPRTGTYSTSSSLDSEEFISGHYDELSNTSTVNELVTIPNNLDNVETNESDVPDVLHGSIDPSIDDTERNGPSADSVHEVDDNRSIFPLREDQFYFGTPKNINRFIEKVSTSRMEAEEIPNTHEKQSDVDDVDEEKLLEINAQHNDFINFYILGTAQSSVEGPKQEVTLPVKSGGPFRSDSTVESLNSLYSAVYGKTSKASNNVASIGTEDSFEEFPEDPN